MGILCIWIRYVGETVAKKLAKHYKNIEALSLATILDLVTVDEIGIRISESVVDFFKNDNNILNIEKLKKNGLQFQINIRNNVSDIFKNKSFVISGIFQNYSRDQLKNIIDLNGGKNLSSVSSKTNYLLAGDKIGPSKLKKANDLGISIISEQDFDKLIKL